MVAFLQRLPARGLLFFSLSQSRVRIEMTAGAIRFQLFIEWPGE